MTVIDRQKKEMIIGYAFIAIFLIGVFFVSYWIVSHKEDTDDRYKNIEQFREYGAIPLPTSLSQQI